MESTVLARPVGARRDSLSVSRVAPPPAASAPALPAARLTGKPPIRLLLADDHALVRRGLVFCFGLHPHIRVVGEARDGREALEQARELVPDVVLMDIDMPVLSGLEATAALKREQPQTKILIFSMHRSPDLILQAGRMGAQGYVLKQAAFEELVHAVEVVHAGGDVFGPELTEAPADELACSAARSLASANLSPREQEVLIAIAEGLTSKDIAHRLKVGVRTVETYRESVMRKLRVRGIAALTRYAIARGLVAMPAAASLAPGVSRAS